MDDEKIRQIEERVKHLELQLSSQGVPPPDSKDKPETVSKLAETSFKTIVDADIHFDNKASRILTAMAFLTAASSAIFSKIYIPNFLTPDVRATLFNELGKHQLTPTLQKAISDALVSRLQGTRIEFFGFECRAISFSRKLEDARLTG